MMESSESSSSVKELASPNKPMNKRQLRREFRAFLGHHHTLCGLEILARVRIRQFLEAMRKSRLERIEAFEQYEAIRERILSEHMKNAPTARMEWDVPKEVDVYIWGPLELFFCSAQAMIDRYDHLKGLHPELVFPHLDQYISDNKSVFDAVENLRDWVTHPGYSRDAHHALAQIRREYEDRGIGHFYEVVRSLLELYRQFLERFDNHVNQK